MEEEVLKLWCGRAPEQRKAIMTVQDPEIVRLIDFNMRTLWTAEIQARQFGVEGPIDPFDRSQLPLVSTMQFDGGANSDEKISKQVKWPSEFYEDPLVVPTALRCALRVRTEGGPALWGGAAEAPQPCSWARLLQPPAKSWIDFERQLAHLVKQLVLHAFEEEQTGRGGAAAVDAGRRGDSVGAELAEHSDNAAGSGDDEGNGAGGEELQRAAPSAARAQKRARQRERRRLGKFLARTVGGAAADGAALATAAELAAAATAEQATGVPAAVAPAVWDLPEGGSNVMRVLEAHVLAGAVANGRAEAKALPAVASDRAAAAAELGDLRPSVAAGVRDLPESATNVLYWLSVEAGHEERGSAGPAREAPAVDSVARDSAAASEALAAAAEAPSAVGLVQEGSGSTASQEASAQEQPPIAMAGFSGSVAARGVGRGRPMGAAEQGPWIGLHGRGMGVGRGKALTPPPGLQGLNLQRRSLPGGLSRPWMPGPPIVEVDDEGANGTPQASTEWPSWPDEDLPDGVFTGVDKLDTSYAASAADWGRTPSTYASPAQSPAMRPAAHPYNSAGGAGGGPAFQLSVPTVPPTMMFVTVPLALAQNCPHCGRHFALPVEGVQNWVPA